MHLLELASSMAPRDFQIVNGGPVPGIKGVIGVYAQEIKRLGKLSWIAMIKG